MGILLDHLIKEAAMADKAKDVYAKGKATAQVLGEQAKAYAKANPKLMKGIGAGAGAAALGAGLVAGKGKMQEAYINRFGSNTDKAKLLMSKGVGLAKANPRAAAALAALGITAGVAGAVKSASVQEQNEEIMEFAKQAAVELADECLDKLAFANQLYNEAEYVGEVFVKQAAEADDMELESDGSALDAFLQELDEADFSEEEEDAE